MADKNIKTEGNVPGKYYVDETCIACGVCPSEAPESFVMNDDGTHAFVYKQPSTDPEKADAERALDVCPANAIGNDG